MRLLRLVFFLLVLGGLLFTGIAEETHSRDSGINLVEGRNVLKVESPIFVRELVVLNPSIEYVKYDDLFLNRQIAYVNVFGGLGENFLLEPGREYEISVKEDIELII